MRASVSGVIKVGEWEDLEPAAGEDLPPTGSPHGPGNNDWQWCTARTRLVAIGPDEELDLAVQREGIALEHQGGSHDTAGLDDRSLSLVRSRSSTTMESGGTLVPASNGSISAGLTLHQGGAVPSSELAGLPPLHLVGICRLCDALEGASGSLPGDTARVLSTLDTSGIKDVTCQLPAGASRAVQDGVHDCIGRCIELLAAGMSPRDADRLPGPLPREPAQYATSRSARGQ